MAKINGSVFVIDTSNFFDAILPPVFNKTQREDILMDWVISKGARGVIVWQTAAQEGGTADVIFNDFSFCRRMSILALEIGKQDGATLDGICNDYAQNGTQFLIELTAGDVNNWERYRRGAFITVFRIIGTPLSAGTAALALAKYALFVKHVGFQLSIPQIILLMHFMASLFRTIIIALDPIYAGLVFVGYQAHMTSTISMPSLFIATLLVALYWKESMDQTRVVVNKFLGKMRIPFILLSVVMILVELINSLLRAIRIGILGVMSTLTAVLYIVILLTLSFIFFIVGVKVLNKLRQSDAMSNISRRSASKSRLRRLTIFLIVSGSFNVFFIISWVLAAFDYFLYTPAGFHAFWTILYLSLILSTLTQVLAIRAPRRPSGLTTVSPSQSFRHANKTSSALSTEESRTGVRSATQATDAVSSTSDDDSESDTGSHVVYSLSEA